jgi:uncharacterized phage protein (TIGR01671 family)
MMMRDILFRGKDADTGEWVYGYYSGPVGVCECYEICDINDVIGSMVDVDPETVGQYTGWEDKNGEKIFEGDICRFKEWWKGKACWIGKVYFEYGIYVIAGGPNEECEIPFNVQMSRLDISEMEVIGNIYDNPELIGGMEE